MKPSNRNFVLKVWRCSELGCDKIFRDASDVEEHKTFAFHCKRCGHGTDSPLKNAQTWRLCEACLAFAEPPPKNKKEIV